MKGFSIEMVFKATRLDEITKEGKAAIEKKWDQGQISDI